jgi:hypothetical protein
MSVARLASTGAIWFRRDVSSGASKDSCGLPWRNAKVKHTIAE